MSFRLQLLLLALLLCACTARRSGIEDVVRPVPAGIVPLTVEQDDQISGEVPMERPPVRQGQ